MKKIYTFLVLLTIFITPNFDAKFLLTDIETKENISASNVCSNQEYLIELEDDLTYKTLVIDKDNYVVDSFVVENGSLVVFPNNAANYTIYYSDLNDTTWKDYKTINLNVSDCGNKKIKDDYKTNNLQIPFLYENGMLSFDNTLIDGYDVEILCQNDECKQKAFADGLIISNFPYVIQFKETFKDNENENRYYELNLLNENNYVIREVNEINQKNISLDVDIPYVAVIIAILSFIYFIFCKKKAEYYRKKERRRKQKKRRRREINEEKL